MSEQSKVELGDQTPTTNEAAIKEAVARRLNWFESGGFNAEAFDAAQLSDEMLVSIFETRKLALVGAMEMALKSFYQSLPAEKLVTEGSHSYFPETVFTEFKERWEAIQTALEVRGCENFYNSMKAELLKRLTVGRKCAMVVAKARAARKQAEEKQPDPSP